MATWRKREDEIKSKWTISRKVVTTNVLCRRITEALCGGRGDDSLSFTSAYRGERTIERGRARSSKRGEYATRLSRGTASQISPGAPRHRFEEAHRQLHVSLRSLLLFICFINTRRNVQ